MGMDYCADVAPDKKPALAQRAQGVNDDLQQHEAHMDKDEYVAAKLAALNFLDQTLGLPSKQLRDCQLQMAENENDNRRTSDNWMPSIHVVHSESTGALARVQLAYPLEHYAHVLSSSFTGSTINIDLYEP